MLGQILVRDFGLDDALLGLLLYACVMPSLLLRIGFESGWRYEQPVAVKASTQADPVG